MQAGQGVLYFRPVVEALPPGDPVRDPGLLESALERSRLRVRAVQDGDGAVVPADPGAGPVDGEGGLAGGVCCVVHRGQR